MQQVLKSAAVWLMHGEDSRKRSHQVATTKCHGKRRRLEPEIARKILQILDNFTAQEDQLQSKPVAAVPAMCDPPPQLSQTAPRSSDNLLAAPGTSWSEKSCNNLGKRGSTSGRHHWFTKGFGLRCRLQRAPGRKPRLSSRHN